MPRGVGLVKLENSCFSLSVSFPVFFPRFEGGLLLPARVNDAVDQTQDKGLSHGDCTHPHPAPGLGLGPEMWFHSSGLPSHC